MWFLIFIFLLWWFFARELKEEHCPYCNKKVYVKEPGQYKCGSCGNKYIYNCKSTKKLEDIKRIEKLPNDTYIGVCPACKVVLTFKEEELAQNAEDYCAACNRILVIKNLNIIKTEKYKENTSHSSNSSELNEVSKVDNYDCEETKITEVDNEVLRQIQPQQLKTNEVSVKPQTYATKENVSSSTHSVTVLENNAEKEKSGGYLLEAAITVIGDELNKSKEEKNLDKYAATIRHEADRHYDMHLSFISYKMRLPSSYASRIYTLVSGNSIEETCNRKFSDEEKMYILHEVMKYSKTVLKMQSDLPRECNANFIEAGIDGDYNLYISFSDK